MSIRSFPIFRYKCFCFGKKANSRSLYGSFLSLDDNELSIFFPISPWHNDSKRSSAVCKNHGQVLTNNEKLFLRNFLALLDKKNRRKIEIIPYV